MLITEAGLRAAFEARLEARWGRGLDLAALVVHEAHESGRWVNDSLRPERMIEAHPHPNERVMLDVCVMGPPPWRSGTLRAGSDTVGPRPVNVYV